jgi:hypothetical protein
MVAPDLADLSHGAGRGGPIEEPVEIERVRLLEYDPHQRVIVVEPPVRDELEAHTLPARRMLHLRGAGPLEEGLRGGVGERRRQCRASAQWRRRSRRRMQPRSHLRKRAGPGGVERQIGRRPEAPAAGALLDPDRLAGLHVEERAYPEGQRDMRIEHQAEVLVRARCPQDEFAELGQDAPFPIRRVADGMAM